MKLRSIGTILLGIAVVGALATPLTTHAADDLLFGQKQAYSAIVRQDGSVVTYGKIMLQNPGADTPLSETSFTVPAGVKIANLSVYQVLLPERCAGSEVDGMESSADYNPNDTEYDRYPRKATCRELKEGAFGFGERYYYAYYGQSSNGELRYKKVALQQDGTTYRVELPEPIKPNARGAYIVSYSATEGYTTNTLGLYSLNFKTLQVPESIQEVRVAVDVARDFYVKEGRSTIDSGRGIAMGESGVSLDSAKEQASSALDTLQRSIGTTGVFIKDGKGLTANETFVVTGTFADAAWKLHMWTIAGVAGGLIVLIVVGILLHRKANAVPARKRKK